MSRTFAEKTGCKLLKIQGSKGWPDRLLLAPNGHMMFLEFKREGEGPRPLQAEILRQLQEMNFMAEQVDNLELFKRFTMHLLQKPGNPTNTRHVVFLG